VTQTLAGAYELVIVDLDGVVYLGIEAVPGAPAAIRSILDAGAKVAYATNNASRGADEVAALLESLGVPARADQVLTSARAAAELLAVDLPKSAPVLVVGAPALRAEISAVGLTPVAGAAERPLAVVQGYGPEVGWADLAEACVAIRAGARWVATNTDATLPSPRGALPGNGSLVAAVAATLGRGPDVVVGKPQPTLFEVAARGAERVLVVGDRIDTDMEGAVEAGMDGLLVLTGVSSPSDVLSASVHQRPTHLAVDLSGLSAADTTSRVPNWDNDRGGARAGGWRSSSDGDHLVLEGEGALIDALRVLAAAAWAHPEWTGIATGGAEAQDAIDSLGLTRFAGWSVRAASAASADHRS